MAGKNGKRGSSFGGNIANVAKKKSGSIQLFNSIIAAAVSGGGGYGAISNGGFNISADKSIKFKKGTSMMTPIRSLVNWVTTAARRYDPLATNSVAIDKIPPDDAPSIDQRGFGRPIGSGSDIGAYELDINRATIHSSEGHERDCGQ